MSNTPTNSPSELLAAFESGFTGMAPAVPRKTLLAERVAVFREQILTRRKSGYSWQQIAEVLRQPKIGVEISPATLRTMCGDKSVAKKPQTKRPITSIRVLPPPAPGATR